MRAMKSDVLGPSSRQFRLQLKSCADSLRWGAVDHRRPGRDTAPQSLDIRPHLMDRGFLDRAIAADVHRRIGDGQKVREVLLIEAAKDPVDLLFIPADEGS